VGFFFAEFVLIDWSAPPATFNRRLSTQAGEGFIRYGSGPDGRKKIELTPKS
jgi:hypothetical protein